MKDWIEKQKDLSSESITDVDDQMTEVDLGSLKKFQRFAYNIVEEFKNKNKQLHLIILGTAGTGRLLTVAAVANLHLDALKRACPKAKAVFLKQGKSCHKI